MNGTPTEEPDFRVDLNRRGRGEAGHPTRPDIRLLDPAFYGDFDELTTWMRAEAPLYWDDETGIWGAASHELVSMMSREWRTFCSGQGSRPESSVPSMINFDAPEHTKRRRLVGHGFTPRRVADHEPYLRKKVTELIDAVIDRGSCDIVADIATPLPMYMIGELMDLPESDHDTLLHWSDLFATGGDQIQAEVIEAVVQWNEYIMGKVTERRNSDREDLVSLIVNAEWEGERLSDVDVMFETMLVLVGGDETTRHVISGGVAALLRNPDQLAKLRDDPSLLPSAIEEMLRWATPVRNMNRTATRDIEVNGLTIRENDRVLLLYPSANRDEKVFHDPFRFDITRDPNDHVAFGAYGRHHCLGAPLARLELRILFEELLSRLDRLQLATDYIEWREGNFVLGPNSVPITFTAR
ncbi:MAG: cytochrome P450 [Actinomycetota bacterium]|nr:cytochrome P450 [Actinomycetota bacterium]MDA2971813.1 cytochrome P450 [Actinomycetota bacterium]MDA3001272.1 cytochrome P450 [Actinomycetota bacterium]